MNDYEIGKDIQEIKQRLSIIESHLTGTETGNPASEEEIETTEMAAKAVESSDISDKSEKSIKRIEGSINLVWSGVRGCSDDVESKVKNSWNDWVEKKKEQNPNLIALRWGHDAYRARCWSRTTWDNKRSCRCNFSVGVWIEFLI